MLPLRSNQDADIALWTLIRLLNDISSLGREMGVFLVEVLLHGNDLRIDEARVSAYLWLFI